MLQTRQVCFFPTQASKQNLPTAFFCCVLLRSLDEVSVIPRFTLGGDISFFSANKNSLEAKQVTTFMFPHSPSH